MISISMLMNTMRVYRCGAGEAQTFLRSPCDVPFEFSSGLRYTPHNL